MTKTMHKAIVYLASNIDIDELSGAYAKAQYRKCPLDIFNKDISDRIIDLLEEWGDDNDLPEGWWLNHTDDIDEIARLVLEYDNSRIKIEF